MQKNQTNVEMLNKAISDELLMLNQNLYSAFVTEQINLHLSKMFNRAAYRGMIHIERLSERLLGLGSLPQMNPSGEVAQETTVKKMLAVTCKMGQFLLTDYRSYAEISGEAGDNITQELFLNMANEKDVHLKQFIKAYEEA